MQSFRVRPAADILKRPEVPTIKSLMSALRSHDPYTYRHSLRTVRLSLLLGRACGVNTHARLRVLTLGALAHDLGKIFIPGGVLHKEGRLTPAEWAAVQRHPLDGARLLIGVAASEGVCRVAAEHHERWDGRGYPAGLSGERIDFNARVVAVADAFDAMTSERAYGPAVGYKEAAAELERCAGTQFDPEVVRVFLRAPRSLLEAVIRPGRE
ncbi:MAG TPA: HD-GYP domain-containing protein [Pyrinomonadaceae bacterium]|nr:HD-GYP domain-containing protein [Pyrinomonadaceae bacterium]